MRMPFQMRDCQICGEIDYVEYDDVKEKFLCRYCKEELESYNRRRRITRKILEEKAALVNRLLNYTGYEVKISGRYGYTAIDLVKENSDSDIATLATGLTKKEAFLILDAIHELLALVKV